MNTAAKAAHAIVNNMWLEFVVAEDISLIKPTRSGNKTMGSEIPSQSAVLERNNLTQNYPEARVIVLDDNVNTFNHVVSCLTRIIPGMSEERAWELANLVDSEGAAEVWRGPLEQAELYHHQLLSEGLTMAPIERC